jgi:hypothetical protein
MEDANDTGAADSDGLTLTTSELAKFAVPRSLRSASQVDASTEDAGVLSRALSMLGQLHALLFYDKCRLKCATHCTHKLGGRVSQHLGELNLCRSLASVPTKYLCITTDRTLCR